MGVFIEGLKKHRMQICATGGIFILGLSRKSISKDTDYKPALLSGLFLLSA